jgi:allantoinase
MIVLRSRRVVLPDGVRPATVWIDGERIVRIGPHDVTVPGAIAADDLGGLAIMPGLVDSHVHVNEPGRAEWEGFRTATRAAAAGGDDDRRATLNSIPATTSVEALHAGARSKENARSTSDCGAARSGQRGRARRHGPRRRSQFKCFMVDSGVPEFGHVSLADLDVSMKALAPFDAPLLVHAELPGPIADAVKAAKITDARSYLRYLQSRPRSAEDQAIEAVVKASKQSGARAHIVHLSSASAVEIQRA